MRIADYVERDNFRQSVADAHTPGTTLPVCDPRLEAIVGHDRHDDATDSCTTMTGRCTTTGWAGPAGVRLLIREGD
jgi:hypothetical protein